MPMARAAGFGSAGEWELARVSFVDALPGHLESAIRPVHH